MKWENIKHFRKEDFKRSTGVSIKTFKLVVRAIKKHDEQKQNKRGNKRSRPFKLLVEDQLLLTLMYYREYRTQFHIGVSYGISEAAVCRTISRIEGIISKMKEFKLPGKKKLSGTHQEYEVIIIDATESPIERPKKTNIGIIRERKRNTH
jgi:hypothetical protein